MTPVMLSSLYIHNFRTVVVTMVLNYRFVRSDARGDAPQPLGRSAPAPTVAAVGEAPPSERWPWRCGRALPSALACTYETFIRKWSGLPG